MRKSKLVVAIGAAVALAATPLLTATTASASSGSNSGSAVTRGTLAAGTAAACAKQLSQPSEYPDTTKLVDLSGIADFTQVSTQNGVKFVPTMEKRSVPGSWATWGSPPATESATPNILYTAGGTSVTVTLPKRGAKKGVAGMEVEPDPFEVHTFTATYTKKSGAEICTATVDADGNAGARLLAAKGVKRAKTITVSSDVAFSVAQIRWK
jgi:hypothetical protein